ncbi:DUF6338 family protein [Psychroserpens sp.]|uniref:DUF6338 family protein n=1 Tax=Psychroserpens sp. TaxID=2020870 RepID=UPI002B267AB7|nr:DUF6338 family protein [Psychroserpens sp.]
MIELITYFNLISIQNKLEDFVKYQDIFIYFFIPGFIMYRVITSMIPIKTYEISKSIIEIITYGAFNYLLFLVVNNYWSIKGAFWWEVAFFGFIPIFISLIFGIILKSSIFRKNIYDIGATPWDSFFLDEKDHYIIIVMKSGKMIGGYFGPNSYASWYPKEKELFLEQEWEVDESLEKLINKVPNTDGIWINFSEVQSMKLYKN